jgi:hypothetical protein
MATGLASLVFGGVATAATVLIASRHGLPGAEPAALLAVVPLAGAAVCAACATRRPLTALTAFTVTGLIYAALAVGPAQAWLARANTLPGFVQTVQAGRDEPVRIGTYLLSSPNVVFYADQRVTQIGDGQLDAVAAFLAAGPDAVLLVPEQHFAAIESRLPPGVGIVNRTRPVFRSHDIVAVGHRIPTAVRTAAVDEEPNR